MANEIYIAKEQTSQEIKQDVKSIEKWKYKSVIYDYISVGADTTASGSIRNLKTVNGEGYLTQALLKTTANTGGYIQVTLDGNIVCKSGLANSSKVFGIVLADDIKTVSTANVILTPKNTNTFDFDTTQSTFGEQSTLTSVPKNLVINEPLFFKESLSIDFISATPTSKTLELFCKGGIKI